MTELDRTTLPLTGPGFSGTVNHTLRGSEPDWNLIRHPEAPQGAPNVLLVLIDDAGFGNPSTFGGPIQKRVLADAGVRTLDARPEPFLVRTGFLARTPRGRVATPLAWSHLGLTAPAGSPFGTDVTLFDTADD